MSRRREKKRRQKAGRARARRGVGLRRAAAILIAVALVAGLLGGALLFRNLASGGGNGPRTAAIVDQLSLTTPNPDFAEKATSLLEQAGYTVDYYPGEQVTVDFYRNLPIHEYDLIILRVHSGLAVERNRTTGQETETEYVSLFTGEPYDATKHVEEVRAGPVGMASYYDGAPPLFGIGPDFIRYSMRGNFDKALIILMGCDGLRSTRTAEAFVEKGASAFVGWSRTVSASHNDAATLRLLQKLLVDGLPVGEAVAQTETEIGPDPQYGAELRVYPSEH